MDSIDVALERERDPVELCKLIGARGALNYVKGLPDHMLANFDSLKENKEKNNE
jgi:hypothetical protein